MDGLWINGWTEGMNGWIDCGSMNGLKDWRIVNHWIKAKGWMEEWMNGWIEGMNGWIDCGTMNGLKRWMNWRVLDRWIKGMVEGMNGWMDGWIIGLKGWIEEMNGWMDEWINGWMDEWMDCGSLDWRDGWRDEWMERRNELKDEWMDCGLMDRLWINGLNRWMDWRENEWMEETGWMDTIYNVHVIHVSLPDNLLSYYIP